ncbi:hypothetical protein DH2020_017122 [Rehmannia glutinosa]|uniref:Uncharacterized protein n=1 Tax=Rehmannia glutinosa TaxID=99300 RepID=A0ABR0WPY8_REHGL
MDARIYFKGRHGSHFSEYSTTKKLYMENSQNRKRTRDDGDEKRESHKGKKPESVCFMDDFFYNDQKRYEFCDDFGVFDFPWLKEGFIFLEPDEKFQPPGTFAANLDLFICPALDGNFHDKKIDDGDRFNWSLRVDDFEPIDCIWSCLIDQPVDIGLDKG